MNFIKPPKNKQEKAVAKIWAIGGGKGGIGKSFISSSLAIKAAKLGHTVTLIDLDLGSANLHTCLGVPPPEKTISDFISGRVHSMEEISTKTHLERLSFISGFNDSLAIADLENSYVEKIQKAIKSLNSQIIILDLGAGTSNKMLDFFLMSDKKIVTITPEPTSVENAYRFMKSVFYRKLKNSEKNLGIQSIINAAMDHQNKYNIKSPNDLISFLYHQHPFLGKKLLNELSDLKFEILINQARARSDHDLGHSVRSICNKYFGLQANYVGAIDYSNTVWQALRKKKAAVLEYPHTNLPQQFISITQSLLDIQKIRVAV